jgi:hypothetical protein
VRRSFEKAARKSEGGRFKGGKDGTLWYYRSLITAFRQASNSELIEELDRVVTELEQLAAKP